MKKHDIQTTFTKLKKNKVQDKKNQVVEPQMVLWKMVSSLSEEVFETTIMAHDTMYDYSANQIQVLWKSSQLRRGKCRNDVISYASQPLIQYMQLKYKWSVRTKMDKFSWKAHGTSLQALKQNTKQIIQKFIFDSWTTNEREAKICKSAL